MKGREQSSRRRFLKVSGLSAAVATAGCLGTGGDGSGTATTSQPMGTPEQSLEEWRAEMKEKAREELKDSKLQVWSEGVYEKETMSKVFNGYPADETLMKEEPPIIDDDDPWAPLRDNVEVTALQSEKQADKYRREVQTGSISKDILTTSYLPSVIRQSEVTDLQDIPAWQKFVPDQLKQHTSKIAYNRGKASGTFYNPTKVDEPPKNLLDLLDDRFSGKQIILDITPNPVVALPFLGEQYADETPPHLEALGSDMTGKEFIEALADQDPILHDSSYATVQKVAKGEAAVTIGGPLSVLYDMQDEGLDIEPMKHPSGHIFRSIGLGITAEPPHPAAARLFIDYVLSSQPVQMYEEGSISVDYEQSNPEGAIDWLNADWQRPYSTFEIQGQPADIVDKWKEVFGAPTV